MLLAFMKARIKFIYTRHVTNPNGYSLKEHHEETTNQVGHTLNGDNLVLQEATEITDLLSPTTRLPEPVNGACLYLVAEKECSDTALARTQK